MSQREPDLRPAGLFWDGSSPETLPAPGVPQRAFSGGLSDPSSLPSSEAWRPPLADLLSPPLVPQLPPAAINHQQHPEVTQEMTCKNKQAVKSKPVMNIFIVLMELKQAGVSFHPSAPSQRILLPSLPQRDGASTPPQACLSS